MTTFVDRESAFENKFAHDEEMQFRAIARRNKLLGLWAAQLLGHSGATAETYADSIVSADMQEVGDTMILRKIAADLQGHATLPEIKDKMKELLPQAQEQILEQA